MGRLTQDGFLQGLTKMIEKSKQSGTGSVQLSLKRHFDEEEKSEKKHKAGKDHACLVHARLGKRKISTLIPYKDHVRFQQQFGLILKVGADGLKKRDKSKKAKRQRQRKQSEKNT